MPGGNGRWGWVAAGAMWASAAGAALGQAGGPPAMLPPTAKAPTSAATDPPALLPGAPHAGSHGNAGGHGHGGGHTNGHGEEKLKDLTPPGLAHHLPEHHEEHHGHLDPILPPEAGLYGSAEFLLWRPRRSAFDFVTRDPNRNLAVEGPVESLNYELRAGIRAHLGYQFGASRWDVLFGYTYFRSGADRIVNADPGGVLYPTFTRPGLTDQVLGASAIANLEYNTYDIEFGKRFCLDKNFAVRGFGGFRFANIRQDYQTFYNGLDARNASVQAQSHFQGFGPMAGAEATLVGLYGFHIYARASGGLLTGLSKNPYLETNDGGGTIYANLNYDIRKVVPVASVGVGAGWQYRTVAIRMGYEITNYFNLIDQPRFSDDVAAGKLNPRTSDLSLEGLFVQFGVGF